MVRTILDIFNAKHDVTAHWWYLRWQSWRQSSPHLLYECVNVGLVGFHYWRIPGKLYCHDDRPLYPWSRWRMLVCRAGCHHISLVQRKGAVFRLGMNLCIGRLSASLNGPVETAAYGFGGVGFAFLVGFILCCFSEFMAISLVWIDVWAARKDNV